MREMPDDKQVQKKNQQVKKPKNKGKNTSARVTYPMVIPWVHNQGGSKWTRWVHTAPSERNLKRWEEEKETGSVRIQVCASVNWTLFTDVIQTNRPFVVW